VTCSVHSDPDQYRFSWRPDGSTSQPGAIPVKAIVPEGSSSRSEACVVVVTLAGGPVGPNALGRPGRRRRDEKALSAKNAKKTTMKSQEPCP
jgi:hypothetical protein